MGASLSASVASAWVAEFNGALEGGDIGTVVALFGDECFWRDLSAFTWNIKTMEGKAEVAAALAAVLRDTRPVRFRVDGEAREADGIVEARLSFETRIARGDGYLRLKDGRCWTLLTSITALNGHEEKAGPRREKGVEHGARRDRTTWLDRRIEEEEQLGYTRQPYCVIVGGGQGGIALGARLRRLGVPAIILEKNERAGDSWRRRYKSLCLHDPVWYDHLPYMPFPDHWPVFSPKDKIGDWLEMYVKIMELPYWPGAECIGARFDDEKKEWAVVVDRRGETVTLRPKHLVIATGMSGMPVVPKFPGAETFRGTQHHSSRHSSGEAWTGKKCVVIGSNNSAHDICVDLWEHGADVTMVQRSPTVVARSETLMDLAVGPLYSEEALARGITTELADLINISVPSRLAPPRQARVYDAIQKRDAEFYRRLKASGFLFDLGEDGSGIHIKYIREGGGYYIDVGGSELIIDGRIKLKVGEVERLAENAVVMRDGTELPADLVVYATGYGSMNEWAAQLISEDVADKVGKCWGVGSGTDKDPGPWEGELRNMWRPTQQEALWFMGGNLFQARVFSLTLALQLKARHEGIPTPVYGLQEVFHRR